REGEMLALQRHADRYLQEAKAAEQQARTAVARAQNLTKRIQEMEIQLTRADTAPAAKGVVSPASMRDPTYVNPPSAKVKGSITETAPTDSTLVKVSIGSDAGVKEDNTLEVFRLSPDPTYLGRLRIVEAHHHSAIGRFRPASTAVRQPLRVGDEV